MNKNLFDLTGKVALVTGASRGIGESIARLLAAYGAEVIVSSRKIDGCEVIAQSIRDNGGKAHAMACHVGEIAQIDATFAQIKEQFGQLDILVNNAAANPFFGHILDTDLAAYDKTVDVNIRGYFFMSVAAGKMMKEQGGGVILNTASVNALSPGDMQGIYSISKAAVVSMTKAFAKECGSLNIRVNALLPGLTDTKFASALTTNDKILKQALQIIPLGRVADPDEMAGTVLYLVSDASSYTTGTTVVVDGGMMA
ncbi:MULTISPECIES: SDR family oxidoreductase [Aliiglaciecola]|uniref:SDR family oxidoreductase n=1 Tax=Aliiglaciecola TaxID=1406885 RepID=UPI001C09D140|nr:MULTISPECIES: SDR family oxidoreductase [Aliiglaciecola]MBU2877206.1 SDR family oxidoreductase [Aliiglaciecola lipolytica]MDO6712136.1 SDR family oxidoreductase [Aliiglaciecola sp. 2_MG-2023]MDO6753216.1 SDR family oxidoreductase [Aliiglaciecola sp. 1_MG-2023]